MIKANQKPVFFIYVHVAFWILMLVFISYLSAVNIGMEGALSRSFLVLICHITNFYVVFSWLMPRYFENKKYWATALGVVLLLVLIFPFRYLIEKEYIFGRNFLGQVFTGEKLLFRIIIVSELSITGFAVLLKLAINSFNDKQKITEMEKAHLETELHFLKSQINPHFLFNTINNLYSLILIKSERAPTALLKLSSLLRYFLYECNGKVAIEKELKAIEVYADLFQIRYEEKLDINMSIQIKRKDKLIEPMLLVPLLENAFKHSGIGVAEGAFVSVVVKEQNNHIVAHFMNSKTSIAPETAQAGGIGLVNIRRRLEMAYSDDHSFIINDDNGIFEATLKIPVE